MKQTGDTTYRNSRAGAATKTYFWVSKNTSDEIKSGKTDTKTFTFQFPPEFIASRNQKWIIIEECKATFKEQLVGDVLMHADFIHRDHFLDYACCFVNEQANKDTAKYECDSLTTKQFKLWFTDLYGELVDLDAFVFRALLIY
jgi:hypothetical protein